MSPGTIVMWGGTPATLPEGWLLCDGSTVDQTTYPALWSAVGTNFGANPPTGSFYLPDLRGRFVRGVDYGANVDPDLDVRTDMRNSTIPSQAVGSIQSHAFQNHVHPYAHFPMGSGIYASGRYWGIGTNNTDLVNSSDYNVSTNETRPVNAALHFIIKY